jgi:hypothetical protein
MIHHGVPARLTHELQPFIIRNHHGGFDRIEPVIGMDADWAHWTGRKTAALDSISRSSDGLGHEPLTSRDPSPFPDIPFD